MQMFDSASTRPPLKTLSCVGEERVHRSVDLIKVGIADAVVRHNVNRVAKRAEQNTAVTAKARQTGRDGRQVTRCPTLYFERGDRAEAPGTAHRRMARDDIEPFLLPPTQIGDAVQHGLVAPDGEVGVG